MSLKLKGNGTINHTVLEVGELSKISNPEVNDICIVTDENRGGIFIYRGTGTDDGGTIFNGWHRQYDGAVNVKWFGATGSDLENDTIAIQNAIDTGNVIKLTKYYTVSSIDLTTSILGLNYDTCGLYVTDGITVSSSNITIEGIGIQANNQAILSKQLLLINSGSDRVKVRKCLIGLVHNKGINTSGLNECYGIKVDMDGNGCQDLIIENNRFAQIFKDTDLDSQATDGFCGGVYFNSSTTITTPSSGVIRNNIFDTIRTEGNSTTASSDADGIRFYAYEQNDDSMDATNVVIENNTFINVEKSAIKVSSIGGLKIYNTTVINHSGTELMLSAIRCQVGNNIVIDGLSADGRFEYGVVLDGNSNILRNANFNYSSGSTAGYIDEAVVLIQRRLTVASNIEIDTINVKNFSKKIVDVYDTLSSSNELWFSGIKINNINAKAGATANNYSIFNILNTDYLSISKINISGTIGTFVTTNNCRRISFKDVNANIKTVFNKFLNTESYSTIENYFVELKDIKVLRTSDNPRNQRFFNFQDYSANSAITGGINISDITIEDYYANASGNHELFFIRGTNGVNISNISVKFLDTDGTNKYQPDVIKAVLSDYKIDGINVHGVTATNTGTIVYNISGSNGLITNINSSSNHIGVRADVGVTSTLVTNVRVPSGITSTTGSGTLTIDTNSVVSV